MKGVTIAVSTRPNGAVAEVWFAMAVTVPVVAGDPATVGRRPASARYGLTRPCASNAAWVSGIRAAHSASIFSATIAISRCGKLGKRLSSY